ncbi:hypothetical protein NLG97_g3344 [Lecanicillium saksenae]|uniref:Uncharacterized protein n=1 Tax=Lecanicillium saksenae TaxID=468837 RepID=A0ACC1R2C4_9HYPO|nr:hypothetical protein NLG97_g3344 [Lecanicillium saksenae]
MCGIVASCAFHPTTSNGTSHTVIQAKDLEAAVEKINYRGPDGSGVWVSSDGSVGLGHCRLAINDLSDAGLQPMHNGSVHAIVNGEIYDYDNLREECTKSGYQFSSTSDSELVIAAYKLHGVPGMFPMLRGEFAFVLYDETNRKLIAARDRYGIKPLFWTTVGDRILLASESKAFLPLGWQPEWDVHSITACGWMSDERTLFKGRLKETRSIEEMILEVRKRFVDAVRVRMKADVPVGVYLSGGIDSSAVAGVMAHLARNESVNVGSLKTTRVSCFTIEFPGQFTHNESAIAERTAESLGVKIFKKYVDEQVLADNFEETSYHCEQHAFDLGQVAKYTLSDFVREQGITVVLSGEGADEHFAGYSFVLPQFLQEPDLSMPDSELTKDDELREALYRSTIDDTARIWESLGGNIQEDPHKSNVKSQLNFNPSAIVSTQPAATVFSSWVHDQHGGLWDRRQAIEAGLEPGVLQKMQEKWHTGHSMLYIVNRCILQSIILNGGYGDRTEMAHAVEGRPPMMDHHLTAYVNMLPPSVKVRHTPASQDLDENQGFWWKSAGAGTRSHTEKWVMREAVRPFVTDELYRRRKQPFIAPSTWPVDGPLNKMFQRVLTKEAVEELGFVDYAAVRTALGEAFGPDANPIAIRLLGVVAAWVTIGKRLGVKRATEQDSGWRHPSSA